MKPEQEGARLLNEQGIFLRLRKQAEGKRRSRALEGVCAAGEVKSPETLKLY
jgi:hypothetical protein